MEVRSEIRQVESWCSQPAFDGSKRTNQCYCVGAEERNLLRNQDYWASSFTLNISIADRHREY
jgi:hypothetical protein